MNKVKLELNRRLKNARERLVTRASLLKSAQKDFKETTKEIKELEGFLK